MIKAMRLLASLLLIAPIFAQQPPDGPRPKRPEPKNLKLLEPTNLMPTMRAFSSSLGVECNHCHVQGNFASDEKPQKETARRMIVMERDINKNFTDGKTHVTCYTCHRGTTEPLTVAAAGAHTDHPAEHPPAPPAAKP